MQQETGQRLPAKTGNQPARLPCSRECVGALIAIERDTVLEAFVETGEALDSEVSAALLRSVFSKRSPLHDGALILSNGRLAAAGCQLPLGQPPDQTRAHMGMRHRAALSLSDETDAIVLVVSEETGRISLAVGGRLEPEDIAPMAVYLASTEARMVTGQAYNIDGGVLLY